MLVEILSVAGISQRRFLLYTTMQFPPAQQPPSIDNTTHACFTEKCDSKVIPMPHADNEIERNEA